MKAKLIAIILFFSALLSAAPLYGQISVTFKDVPLMEALSTLENKSEYSFFYSNMLPDKDARVSIDAKDKSIEFILDNIFSNLSISYEINGHQIVLSEDKKEEKNTSYKASGVVIDSAGEPVIGAGVVIEGSTNGTITDVDGRWELVVPSTTTKIVISSLGYKEQIVAAGSASARTVTLQEDSQMLQETVVVGYGVQKKVNLTGAVAMVNSEEMNARPISSVASGLQGLLPGVTVVNSSSQPGQANTTIRVRGVGTIGNSNPLILIDGIEGDISSINPEDIESVSVLKDAASSAIYGARAANGVLLVTTKKLAAGKDAVTKINFSAYAGIQTPTRLPEMCDAIEFMTLDNEARKNVDTADAWLPEDFDKVRNNTDPNYFGNTDWIGQVLKKVAPQQNYSLSLNGTLGNSGYMLSYRYFDQSGLTVGNSTGETRHNLRFKINTKLIDRVTLSSNLGYTTTKVISPVSSLTSGGGAIYTAMRIAPNAPVRYTDGSWAYGGGNTNPVAILRDGGRAKTDADELSIMEVVKVDILKGWDVSATYNVTSYNGLKDILKKTITFNNPQDGSTYSYQSPNSIKNIDYRHNQQTFILQTNFDLNFGKHNVSGVVGMSQEWYTSRSFEASRTKLITEQDPTLNLGDPQTMSNASSYSSWAIRSGFGRISYNWNERYLLEGN